MDREIRNDCRKATEEWIDEQCQEIENFHTIESTDIHKKIKALIGKKFFSSSGCIKSKDGALVMEKSEIAHHWAEYIDKLFKDTRGEKRVSGGP